VAETGAPLEEGVRRQARARLAEADALLRAIDEHWAPPPFDPLLVAQALGIRCAPVSEPWLEDAMIFVQEGRPTILYRPDRPRARTNFNLFHEIAHTLFPDYLSNPRYRHPRRPRLFEPEGRLEYLCDLAATEFLMPMDLFCADLREGGFGAGRAEALAARYGASVEAVCLRMVEADLKSCALVLVEPRRQLRRGQWRELERWMELPRQEGQRLRATYAVLSEGFRKTGLSFPTCLALGRRNCLDRAARSRKLVASPERLELGRGQSQSFYAEALPLNTHPSRRGRVPVLAFFYPR
jgi:Zn-dependent peptidase ImmA (M78 family)